MSGMAASLPGIMTCRFLASGPATSRQLSDQMLQMSPLSCPGIMLLQMFVLLGTAKVYSLTIDDTISERLVDPSDVSYISDQVNKEDIVYL